ncbi:MAG: hypothetical protein HY393_02820 [Candidatus Diapherotrites archaeon]|nr:hypothetical protein [Candidatus Diapherotrites archaeon]
MSKKKLLTIVIGGDMEKDEREFFENPQKAVNQPQNTLYLDSYEQLHEILSPAKLDLLRYLIQTKRQKQCKGVGMVAKDLKRKQEAISRDLHHLQKLKLVELKKEKQRVLAQTKLEAIQIVVKS